MEFTYAALSAQLQSLVEDTLDLSLVIGEGEGQALLDLDLDLFSTEATGNAAATIVKPATYHYLRSPIALTSGPTVVLLERRAHSYLKAFWPSTLLSGVPKYFSDASETAFAIAPTPVGWSYRYDYGFRPAGLSDLIPTTWLSLNAGEVLYHACVVAAHKYLKNDARAAAAKSDYQGALSRAIEKLSGSRMARLSPTKTVAATPAPSEG